MTTTYVKREPRATATLESLQAEVNKLRQRVWLQRRELRRLNKVLPYYWAGFNAGTGQNDCVELRKVMFARFGHDAVLEAEHKAIRARLEAVEKERKT